MKTRTGAIADQIRAGELDDADALQAVEAVVLAELGEEAEAIDPLAIQQEEEQRKRDEEARRNRVNAIGHRLHAQAREQVTLRQQTEERWYQDVRQFNGQYEPGTFTDDEGYGSRVFVPLTRRLVGLCEARLSDMLFPSDERFYNIDPTPVPDLDEAAQLAEGLPQDQMVGMPGGAQVPAGAIQESIKALVEEARKRADAMQREIDDQLAECKYPTHARNAIHDAVLLGTGVLKGPTPLEKTSKRWINQGGAGFVLEQVSRPVPVAARVDPWNFFPDMSATTIDEAEFVFERHFLTKKQVSALQEMQDVDLDALRLILRNDPTRPSGSDHRERLRAINGASGAPDKRYEVWEYHGPLDADDLRDCGVEIAGDDPLVQYTGIVWFCEGVVLKAALNPLDSGGLPYRVFTWQKDESNIFGFGLPYEVRDNQTSANSAFRAMQDNMGLCARPNFVVDDNAIEPIDGQWEISPGKGWRNKRANGGDIRAALQFINIESRLQELQTIFATSKQLIEEVGTLPAFLQGQEAPAKMQSATEASIAWTAANLWVRRCVRNWDDDIVTPLIGDFYDWNMQYSPKAELKGDSKVRAMGIASLVELEGQAQKLQLFVQGSQAMGVPLSSQLSMLRQLARAYKLDPDLVLPSEQEIAKMREQEAQNPRIDPEQLKLKIAEQTNNVRIQEIEARSSDLDKRMHLELMQIASNEKVSLKEAQRRYGYEIERTAAELQDRREQRGHDAQMLNAEAQLKVQMGSGI